MYLSHYQLVLKRSNTTHSLTSDIKAKVIGLSCNSVKTSVRGTMSNIIQDLSVSFLLLIHNKLRGTTHAPTKLYVSRQLKKKFDHKYFNGIASSSLREKLRFKFVLSDCCRS